ncbi:MAG TPA: class I SAM-dependent methyltransferase [Chitinophagales bacterium]|jgi:ubiquinone/menaquinone biosynthesis C-methylase UbiE|nr:class I SAM-dependent methyltransferase [Chitinophagales bacterium]
MGFYSKHILPSLINLTCKTSSLTKQREKVIPFATGNILEIGVGTGLNLPFYNSRNILKLTAIDPYEETWQKREIDSSKLDYKFEFVKASAEELPFKNNTFDTIVITYSLCTIPDVDKALREMSRVLKQDGTLIFCEHGVAPDKKVSATQDFINPIWKPLSGGCNLNRNIPELIEKNGFTIQDLKSMYIPGWKFASYNFWGSAKKTL